MLTLSCTGCHKKLAVAENLAGKKIKCPGCAQVLAVPALSAVSRLESTRPPAAAGVSAVQQTHTRPPADPSAADRPQTVDWSGSSEATKGVPSAQRGTDASLTAFLAPAQAPTSWAGSGLPRPQGAGRRRHGRGLPGRGPPPAALVALKAMLPALAASARPANASCARPGPRPAQARPHRHHPPGRRGPRRPLPGHGVPRGRVAGRPPQARGPAARWRRCCASAGRWPRAWRRPTSWADPPRHQAGQRLAGGPVCSPRPCGAGQEEGAGSRSSTSAWPGRRPGGDAPDAAGPSWARRPTWPRSRPRARGRARLRPVQPGRACCTACVPAGCRSGRRHDGTLLAVATQEPHAAAEVNPDGARACRS